MINKLYNKMQDQCLPCNCTKGLQLIQQALQIYNRLLLKEQSCKIELDQPQGQQIFREYMDRVEHLIKQTKSMVRNRQFRSTYTNAYKVLYQDNSLGYIPQIYDSAQEGFPFIYVNGEKYDFSSEVLLLGQKLVESYYKMVHQFRVTTLKKEDWLTAIRNSLEDFDQCWTIYEEKYISELIRIENHSKSAIKLILEAQQALYSFQTEQKLKGKIFLCGTEYDNLRRALCKKICQLNSVANIDGKGRDDLTFEILSAAENVLGTITQFQSRSVRVLAQKIRESYENIRQVLRFFGQNFEMVDPQLKNNPELVLALQEYQCYWQKGKRYFLQEKKQTQIITFSTIVQAAKEKYSIFRQLIDYSDPSIFWIIPSLIVLRSLQDQDEGLAQSFFTNVNFTHKYQQYTNLKCFYLEEKSKSKGFSLYNRLQNLLICQQHQQKNQTIISILNKVKEMAVSLERINPMDWNDMLGVLLLDCSI